MLRITSLLSLLLISYFSMPAFGQGGGGFGGGGSFSNGYGGSYGNGRKDLATYIPPQGLSTETALSVIQVSGTVEEAIAPEEIRLVIALTSRAQTEQDCEDDLKIQTDAIMKDWMELKIPKEKIVQDFISVLPIYEWDSIDSKTSVQKKTSYRMQTNLHVAVPSEADALKAINKAYLHGNAEIVTFNYWSKQIDEAKARVIEKAVEEAKRKAKVLLSVFEEQPQPVNIKESTVVRFPQSMYDTYHNALTDQLNRRSGQSTIEAFRPRIRFLRQLQTNADVSAGKLMMKPEIIVVSTVHIYYRSPAEGHAVGRSTSVYSQ